MSRLFYDHLVSLNKLETVLKNTVADHEERNEIWKLIDNIVHETVLTCIFDKLPKENHSEFLLMIEKSPHDETHLLYIKQKSNTEIEKQIIDELTKLELKLLKSFT